MFGTRLFTRIYERFFPRPHGSLGSSISLGTRETGDVRNKPWNDGSIPRTLYEPKGMIGPEERRALYWLGKHWFSGQGVIVDAGAFVGCSAFCLAAGLKENIRAAAKKPCLYSFDYFRAIDTYVADAISRDFRPIEPGEDYLDIFLSQTKPYSGFIQPIAGDFTQMRWTGGPIEILFIDVAKNQQLNSHLLREFFPHLIVGKSLVIHQDFFHCWHPYIHITMQALAPHFEIVDEHISYQSRLYRYVRTIPSDLLVELAGYTFSAKERIALLDTLAAEEIGHMRAMAQVVKLWQLVEDEDDPGVHATYSALIAEHGAVRNKGLWWDQAKEVLERHLQRQHKSTEGPLQAAQLE